MPDLNSVPPSPRPLPPHLREGPYRPSNSQTTHMDASMHVLPSNQNTMNQSRRTSEASQPSPFVPTPSSDRDSSALTGPGPTRHPRPLTAAELHAELEKEQEAVVNRLNRELQLLRTASNASAVSNTSSTSGNTPVDQANPVDGGLTSSGFSIPSTTSRRHNRTSSSTSARSFRSTAATAGSSGLTSTAHRGLGTSPSWDQFASNNYFQGLNRSTSSQGHGPDQQLSPGLMPGTTRYEETIHNRDLLESALQENEMLKQRIRELERMLRERRRSDTASTNASPSISATATTGGSVANYRQRPAVTRERSINSTITDLSGLSTRSIAGSSVTGRASLGDHDEVDFGESASTAG